MVFVTLIFWMLCLACVLTLLIRIIMHNLERRVLTPQESRFAVFQLIATMLAAGVYKMRMSPDTVGAFADPINVLIRILAIMIMALVVWSFFNAKSSE